jgi:predicted alpha-1,2-mannosidase
MRAFLFLGVSARSFFPIFLIFVCCCLAFVQPGNAQLPSSYVNPLVGTDAHGHTHPAATRPFGMVQLGPDTRLDPNDWDGSSGYHYSDSTLYGFSHTHLSGTGVSDFCDLLFLPFYGEKKLEPKKYAAHFDKKTEQATPGYYAVTLTKSRIRCEMTATDRVGVHRYTYPTGREKASLLIDLRHRDVVLDAHLRVVNDRELEGYRVSSSWAKEQHFYFVIRFSKRFFNGNVLNMAPEPAVSGRSVTSKSVAGVFDFYHDGEPLVVTVGVSGTSMEGARRNLEAECTDFDFDQVWNKAEQAWDDVLGRVEVAGGTQSERRIFYTAMYHALLAPNLWSDADGQYRGRDGRIHPDPGHAMYHVFSLWDTYRGCWPLQALVCPERVRDFVKTFARQAEEGGVLPVWELAANETGCMIGNHALPAIAEAYQHGLVDRADLPALYKAMQHSLERDTLGLKSWRERGYIAMDQEAESVSKSLEYAFDAWCVYQLAMSENLRRQDPLIEPDRRFYAQSQQIRHLFDPETGFFRGKSNGTWHRPFDPREVNFNYTEANAWQYRFAVQHEPYWLSILLGGHARLSQALDSLFEQKNTTTGRNQADITGLIGQYAHGNEPCHHVPWLYNSVGQPLRTRRRVRQIMQSMYHDRPDGLCGNDDCGQMSAWYVWAALGMYPMTPGSGQYELHEPSFETIKIQLESGKSLIIKNKALKPPTLDVRDELRYRWNGRVLDATTSVPLDLLLAGGELVFESGRAPTTVPGVLPADVYATLGAPALPYVAEGERVFEEKQRIAFGHLDPAVLIWYRDEANSDTTWRRYEGPFWLEKGATWHFFAEKNGQRSLVERAIFSKKENNLRVLRYATQYSPQYTARGEQGICDLLMGGADFRSGGWQGYEGVDLDVVLDLGEKRRVTRLWTNCMQDENSWIFFPTSVRYEVSDDARTWEVIGSAGAPVGPDKSGSLQHKFEFLPQEKLKTRYVRVVATNRGKCPEWHKGRGYPAWIFADEVGVE